MAVPSPAATTSLLTTGSQTGNHFGESLQHWPLISDWPSRGAGPFISHISFTAA
jgi:hypothetical protein